MLVEQSLLYNWYLMGAKEFTTLNPGEGVISYPFDEKMQGMPADWWGYLGIYPRFPLGTKAAFYSFTDPEKEVDPRRVSQLQLPERIKRIEIEDKPFFVSRMESLLFQLYRPSILLAFGEERITRKEVAVLFCIDGVNPQTALEEIQQRLREARAKRN